jgi:tetratricopeptide (TPR) repeat protein
MKIYKNPHLRFSLEVPDTWAFPSGPHLNRPVGSSLIFSCDSAERFNILVGPLIPEPPLQQTEQEFRRHAEAKGYTKLSLGRIVVGSRAHVWARYRMTSEDITKKYLLVFEETEYAITATCFDEQIYAICEQAWDTAVASFQFLPQIESNAADEHQTLLRSQLLFDQGLGYFRTGRFQEALALFEQGIVLSRKYPWHFLGISMTTMQMIETGVTHQEQIGVQLAKAEYYIDQCLEIAPRERDYLEMKKAIRNYRLRYRL